MRNCYEDTQIMEVIQGYFLDYILLGPSKNNITDRESVYILTIDDSNHKLIGTLFPGISLKLILK